MKLNEQPIYAIDQPTNWLSNSNELKILIRLIWAGLNISGFDKILRISARNLPQFQMDYNQLIYPSAALFAHTHGKFIFKHI